MAAQTHAHTHESDLIPPRVTRATFHDIRTAHRGESRTFPVSRRDASDSRSSPLGGKNRVVLALPASSFCFRTDGALRLDAPSPRGSSHRVPLPSDASVLTYRPSRPVAFATERQVSTKHALTSAAEAAEKVRNSSERGY